MRTHMSTLLPSPAQPSLHQSPLAVRAPPGQTPLALPSLPQQVYNPRIRAESQGLRPISKKQAEGRRLRAAGCPPGEPCPCAGVMLGSPHPRSGDRGLGGYFPHPFALRGPSCPTGSCVRLYSESVFEERLPDLPPPPITEADLSRLVLLLKRLDIADMGQCDFLDRPGGRHGGRGLPGRARGRRKGCRQLRAEGPPPLFPPPDPPPSSLRLPSP